MTIPLLNTSWSACSLKRRGAFYHPFFCRDDASCDHLVVGKTRAKNPPKKRKISGRPATRSTSVTPCTVPATAVAIKPSAKLDAPTMTQPPLSTMERHANRPQPLKMSQIEGPFDAEVKVFQKENHSQTKDDVPRSDTDCGSQAYSDVRDLFSPMKRPSNAAAAAAAKADNFPSDKTDPWFTLDNIHDVFAIDLLTPAADRRKLREEAENKENFEELLAEREIALAASRMFSPSPSTGETSLGFSPGALSDVDCGVLDTIFSPSPWKLCWEPVPIADFRGSFSAQTSGAAGAGAKHVEDMSIGETEEV